MRYQVIVARSLVSHLKSKPVGPELSTPEVHPLRPGMIIKLFRAASAVRELLRAEGLQDHVREIDRRTTVASIVEAFLNSSGF